MHFVRDRRSLSTGGALLATVLLAGCVSVPDLITRPRRLSPIDTLSRIQMEQALELPRQAYQAPDGTSISWLRVDPIDRGFGYEVHRTRDSMRFGIRTTRRSPDPVPVAVHGSVVWLHGWGMDGSSVMPWALGLAGLGYTGVVVDLRNHGFSPPAPVGYGVHEAGDVAALVRHLIATDSLPRPVFLAGISYGGSTALLAESQLHGEIAGIIAMAPFANAGESIRFLLQKAADPHQRGVVRRLRAGWLRRQIRGERLDALVEEAGTRLEMDLDAVDIGPAVAASRTCIVQLHGVRDRVIPIDSARSLAAHGDRIQLHELPDENHLTLSMRVDWLAGPLVSWMQDVAGSPGADCPSLQLPADPLGPSTGPEASGSQPPP